MKKKNLKINKPPAKQQGPIFNSLKSFAALQNIVRLSLKRKHQAGIIQMN